MSEHEIQERREYKYQRKKWMFIQIGIILLLVAVALSMLGIYNVIGQTQYIEYAESSHINYKVQYGENEFFDGEWLEKDQSYISSLTENISADFSYSMNIASLDMSLEYLYWIDAKMVITDKNIGAPYYTVEDRLLTTQKKIFNNQSSVKISEKINIDYVHYDSIARSFIDTYDLENGVANLAVTFNVKTKCSNENFANDCQKTYSTTLNIPLASDTFSIYSTSASPENAVNTFEYQGVANSTVFLIISIVTGSVACLAIIGLLLFLRLTRNFDITYAARVRNIFNSYSSFIQRINGDFDVEGYQVVMVKTFSEMLAIRDTIQSPILACENSDETMTRFFIPSDTKLLYVFEIKVDNYDDIYSRYETDVKAAEEDCIEKTLDAPKKTEKKDDSGISNEALAGIVICSAAAAGVGGSALALTIMNKLGKIFSRK